MSERPPGSALIAPDTHAPVETSLATKVPLDRIDADGNYVVVHAGGESYRLRDSLEGLARRLGEQRCARGHRVHVVKIDRIREIQSWDRGGYRILLKDGGFVNFSRRYRSRLQHLLE